jgi:hypothetical protein
LKSAGDSTPSPRYDTGVYSPFSIGSAELAGICTKHNMYLVVYHSVDSEKIKIELLSVNERLLIMYAEIV